MNIPPLPPLEPPGHCPAHPFEGNHDNAMCREERLNRAIRIARDGLTYNIDTIEQAWVLAYLNARYGPRPDDTSFGDVKPR